MIRTTAERYVDCPFSAVMELAENALHARTELYLTPSAPLGEQVAFSAKTTDDATDTARRHDALLIAWKPRTHRLFPDFRGVLTARPEKRGAHLLLTGWHTPPFGAAGAIFDVIAGRRIARRTLKHLLRSISAAIEAGYRAEVARASVLGG
ncbi:MAG: hypothetical protein ABR508_03185 [Candidatus Baltobacteraceae bacterium]